jgi:hypothetical protein
MLLYYTNTKPKLSIHNIIIILYTFDIIYMIFQMIFQGKSLVLLKLLIILSFIRK